VGIKNGEKREGHFRSGRSRVSPGVKKREGKMSPERKRGKKRRSGCL